MSAKLHEEDYPCIIRSVAGIIFLGTPHRGSNSHSKASVIANIASAVSLGEQSSLLKAVEKDSEMLADLLQDFTHRQYHIDSSILFLRTAQVRRCKGDKIQRLQEFDAESQGCSY